MSSAWILSAPKLSTQLSEAGVAEYRVSSAEASIFLNEQLGRVIRLKLTDQIHCVGCGRKISKTFQQGYCFPCTQTLPECDLCMVKPELCHFAAGTCRDEAFAHTHCFQPHYVYLANSSGLKVGLTRAKNVPHRFIDQGASEARLIAKTASRRTAGLLEVHFKQSLADKTNWRKMLMGESSFTEWPDLQELKPDFGALALELDWIATPQSIHIRYPVLEYPKKVISLNLVELREITGTLLGIKGQYLILDQGVINWRKHAGHTLSLELV